MVQIGHLFNDIFFHSKLCALQKQFQGAYFTTVENSEKNCQQINTLYSRQR